MNNSITPTRRLLDIGNGGVFDYDTSLAERIVAVDLFLDDSPPTTIPSNVVLRRGDALQLDEDDSSFDRVLSVFVLHHLVSTDVKGTIANIRRALAEA